VSSTAPSPHAHGVARLLPVLGWARAYDRRWLVPDVLAGVAVWAMVIPEGAAYAQLAGLQPQAALAAAPIALLAYALLGSSRAVVVGATTASAVVVGSTLGPLAGGGTGRYVSLAAALTLLVGVAFLALGTVRLGWISQFLSRAVLTGFVFGLGLVVAVGQLPKLLGIQGTTGNFFQRGWDVLRHLDGASGTTVAIGAGALAILFGLARYARRVPGALVVVALGIAITALFGLDGHGVAIVGSIPGGLPQPALPSGISMTDLGTLMPGALAVCLIAYSEHMAAAHQLAATTGEEIDPNQELIALGVANVGAGIVQGFVVGGSLSKSEVNAQAGARTQVSSLSAAALALVTVVALTGVFHDLPVAVLGAVVIHAVSGLMRVGAMRRFWRIRRFDFVLASTALAGELLLDVLPGLLVAVGLSLAYLIYRSSWPNTAVLGRLAGTTTYADVVRHPEAETFPGVVIIRPDAQLFFANAARLRFDMLEAVRHAGTTVRALVCDLEVTSQVDIDAIDMLEDVARRLQAMGCTLYLARVRDSVLDVTRRAHSSVLDALGSYRTVDDAVIAAQAEIAKPAPETSPRPATAYSAR
jgi:sulfate permease, SulP family